MLSTTSIPSLLNQASSPIPPEVRVSPRVADATCAGHIALAARAFCSASAAFLSVDYSREIVGGELAPLRQRLRDECLNVNVFTTLERASSLFEAWRQDYNNFRPHIYRRDAAGQVCGEAEIGFKIEKIPSQLMV